MSTVDQQTETNWFPSDELVKSTRIPVADLLDVSSSYLHPNFTRHIIKQMSNNPELFPKAEPGRGSAKTDTQRLGLKLPNTSN